MSIVALDPSLTSFGWAAWYRPLAVPRAIEFGTIKPNARLRGMRRIAQIVDAVESVVFDDGVTPPDLVVLEGYSFGSRGRAAVSLGELGGVLRWHLRQWAVPWVELAPSQRAKIATGKGNAGKEAVLVEAVKRLGYDGSSTDEADALWLLHAALIHYGKTDLTLPKSHLAALDAVEWPQLQGGDP